jgi:hypothetical protein
MVDIKPGEWLESIKDPLQLISLALNFISIMIGIVLLYCLEWWSWEFTIGKKILEGICWFILVVNILCIFISINLIMKVALVLIPLIGNVASSIIGILYARNPDDDWKKKY